MSQIHVSWLLGLAVALAACDGNDETGAGGDGQLDPNVPPITDGAWYRPTAATTWQWQLGGTVNTGYDVEIYDNRRLVYAERRVPDPVHTLSYGIEACKSYRWSVRPTYRLDGQVRYGEWMRAKPQAGADDVTAAPSGNGNIGRKASQAPAYIQDFALLTIKC